MTGKHERYERQHETEPVAGVQDLVQTIPLMEELAEIQQIEGGGPPKPADLSAMPRPVRWFGYFVMAAVVGMALAALVLTWMD
ncbi:hypothetical protein ACVNS2_36270 [Paenibacillus caseinilyticus]|uniref:Uncharacterized protein n=1 Tax=Paenibacillus mucilaginosus K02 TaxID=997761 RepID=I0BUU4_9BACL|nr:hypothetical protein [Paenibacillus mucilaginosus]AFH66141.1 hypothetical protein B2K_36520 [Paenibacillus mucilaginosus K02]